jgi:hypothetical protein
LNEFYPIQVLRPDRQVTGRTYHVVELSGPFGAREIWYLDAITGLLVQMDSESDDDTGSGVHVVTTTFEDYRLVDAVRVPFRITRQDGKRNYSMTVTAIRNNVPLTLEDFAAAK